MDVGAELRQAREQRGLSLHDLSQHTKISPAALTAIEKNDVGHLPGGIFTRGFLRAYAREVGLDSTDIVQRYVAQFEPAPAPTVEPAVAPASIPAVSAAQFHSHFRPHWAYWPEHVPVVRLMGVLALAALAYLLLVRPPAPSSQDHVERPRGPSAAPGDGPAQRPEKATAGAVVPGVSPSVGRSDVLRIDLLPGAVVWVSATADGNRVTYRLMQPGDRQTIEVRNELVLRVGEPAKFSFTINGRSGRLLGRPGQPATARITLQNHGDFLAR